MAKRKLSAFEKAFAKARREQGADGEFIFNGKPFNTRRLDDPPKSKAAPRPKMKPRMPPEEDTTGASMTQRRRAIRARLQEREKSKNLSPEKVIPREDPAAAGIKGIRSGQTPREALAGKTHVSPSIEASGRGPGGTEHPGMGLRGATIRKEIEETTPAPVIRAPEGPTKRRPTPEEIEEDTTRSSMTQRRRAIRARLREREKRKNLSPEKRRDLDLADFSRGGAAKKKPVKKNIGGMMRYGHGGKVRGAGKAVKGVRPAKMVSMKGS